MSDMITAEEAGKLLDGVAQATAGQKRCFVHCDLPDCDCDVAARAEIVATGMLRRAAPDLARTVIALHADRDRLAAANTALEAQVARLVGALGRTQRALKPFADRVFDDNGDCTVSDTHTLTLPDYWNAKNAERIVCAALAEVQADARREGGE